MNPLKRIKKISHSGGFVTVIYETEKGLDTKEIHFKSDDKPHDDLFNALNACEEVVREICDFPESWCKGKLKVTGVTWSFSKTTEVTGACVIAQALIDNADAPLNIVTPHLSFEQYSESGNSKLMPHDCQAILDTLEVEAMAYVEGRKRAQLSLELVQGGKVA